MIVVKIIGGLGNQLFQYAVARHLSIIHGAELRLDVSSYEKYKLHSYGLDKFNIKQNYSTNDDLIRLTPFKERYFHFDPNFKKIKNNTYLTGYWQSEHYFREIKSTIKTDLMINREMSSNDKVISQEIFSTNSVAIHIRRGDYIPGTYEDQVSNCLGLSYYKSAIDEINKRITNPVFFVFSDDGGWVRENLKLDLPTFFVDHNTAETNYQDLRLMSLCKHNIIANSSFSWWAAWLNENPEKEVYAPQEWFSKNARNLNPKDLIPSSWHII